MVLFRFSNEADEEMDLNNLIFKFTFGLELPCGSLDGGNAWREETGTMCALEKKSFLVDLRCLFAVARALSVRREGDFVNRKYLFVDREGDCCESFEDMDVDGEGDELERVVWTDSFDAMLL